MQRQVGLLARQRALVQQYDGAIFPSNGLDHLRSVWLTLFAVDRYDLSQRVILGEHFRDATRTL